MVIDKDKILNIAQKYVIKGQSQKAIKEYQKLLEDSPKDKRLYLKLGDLYLKNGENDTAIEQYLKVAQLYEEEDLNFRAISMYKKILSIDQKHLEALRKIASLYSKEGLRGDARNYYQTILKISPNDQNALGGLKQIEEQRLPKDLSRRVPPVEPPLPRHPPPSEKRAVEPRPMAETPVVSPSPTAPAQAAPVAQESVPSDKDSEMHYHLGIAYKEMELFDYAISEFEMASANPSLRFDCYIMLGNCYMEKGDYGKSIECYRMATQAKGLTEEKLAHLHYNLGLAYEANGMIPEALHTFNEVLKLDQSFAGATEKIKKLQQK